MKKSAAILVFIVIAASLALSLGAWRKNTRALEDRKSALARQKEQIAALALDNQRLSTRLAKADAPSRRTQPAETNLDAELARLRAQAESRASRSGVRMLR